MQAAERLRVQYEVNAATKKAFAVQNENETAEEAVRAAQEAAEKAAGAAQLAAENAASEAFPTMASQLHHKDSVKCEMELYFSSEEGKRLKMKRLEDLKELIMDELVNEAFTLDGAKSVLSRHFLRSAGRRSLHVIGEEEVLSELVLAALLTEWIGEAGVEPPKSTSQKIVAVNKVALWLFEEGE
jgi:hypothetical protein